MVSGSCWVWRRSFLGRIAEGGAEGNRIVDYQVKLSRAWYVFVSWCSASFPCCFSCIRLLIVVDIKGHRLLWLNMVIAHLTLCFVPLWYFIFSSVNKCILLRVWRLIVVLWTFGLSHICLTPVYHSCNEVLTNNSWSPSFSLCFLLPL